MALDVFYYWISQRSSVPKPISKILHAVKYQITILILRLGNLLILSRQPERWKMSMQVIESEYLDLSRYL